MKVKEFDITELEPWAPAVELTRDLLKTMGEFKHADNATLSDMLVAVFMLTRKSIKVAADVGQLTRDAAKLDELLQSVVSSLVAGRCPELIEPDGPGLVQ